VRSRTVEDTAGEDLIRIYLHDIGRRPLLGAEREIALAKAIEAANNASERLSRSNGSLSEKTRAALRAVVSEGERARSEFIEANLRLVVSIARRYQGFGLLLLDLIQDGNLGLLRAVEKYDWRRGFKFSTYATWWIRQGITRGLADRSRTIRLPVHVADVINRLRRAETDLITQLGREPTNDELARALGIDADQLEWLRHSTLETISLSAPLGEDSDAELHDFLEDSACMQPLDEAVRVKTAEELRDLLGTLSDREKRILELRFGLTGGECYTLEQVGKEFGLTRERIRQIEAKALAKLRHPARRSDFDGLLD